MTSERLLERLDALEEERHALLARLEGLPRERLDAVPPNGGWSVAQVITHLAVVEEGALAYLNKKLEYRKHQPVSWIAGIRLLILNTGLQLPVKYKAPAVVAVIPRTTYADARARWCMAREALIASYSALPEGFLRHDLFKHPTLGRFDPARALRFMRRHMLRHERQIQRTLRAVGSSAE